MHYVWDNAIHWLLWVEIVAFMHHLNDAKLVITMDMSNKDHTCFQQDIINSLFIAKMIPKLPIRSFSRIQKHASGLILVEVIDSTCTSILTRLH